MSIVEMIPLTIDVRADVLSEINYILEVAEIDEKDIYFQDIEGLINYLFTIIADGARKPSSWERSINNQLEIYMDSPVFSVYRAEYGDPDLGEF